MADDEIVQKVAADFSDALASATAMYGLATADQLRVVHTMLGCVMTMANMSDETARKLGPAIVQRAIEMRGQFSRDTVN